MSTFFFNKLILDGTDSVAYSDTFTEQFSLSVYDAVFPFPDPLVDFVSTGSAGHDQFESTKDGNPVVRSYNNFTINAGHTVTTTNRCKGLYLNIYGDLIVNGTLSMTARGAKAPGKYVLIHAPSRSVYHLSSVPTFPAGSPPVFIINKNGGARQTARFKDGNPGTGGACGGGASGSWTDNGGFGGAGTSFSGGAGGGAHYGLTSTGGNAEDDGGAGGTGVRTAGGFSGVTCSGGAGNPGGKGSASGTDGQDGTGGLMILFVKGKVIIGDKGSIQSKGSNAGNVTGHADSRFGGGSGGGSINIFTPTGLVNNPSLISVAGGVSGTRPSTATLLGKSGGNGSITIGKLY